MQANNAPNNPVKNNQPLINQVKAHFTLQNTSLNRFCLDNAIDPSHASKALRGTWKGEKATEICKLIAEATGININGE
jgi:hypothetical protein